MAKWLTLEELQAMQSKQQSQPQWKTLEELQSAQTPDTTKENFFDFWKMASNVVEWTKNLIWWAIAQVPQIAANISSVGQKALSYIDPVNLLDPEYAKKRHEKDLLNTKTVGEWSKAWLQNLIWVDPNATTTKVWEFWAEVWTSLLMPWWVAAKGAGMIAKAIPSIWKRLLGFWAETLWQATATAGISKGELPSATDIATQWVLWWVMKGIGAAGKWAYSQFIPRTEKEVVNIIAWKSNLASTVADTALQQWLRGTKSQIGKQAFQQQQKIWQNEIWPTLKQSQSTITKNELLGSIRENINKTALASEKAKYQEVLQKLEQDIPDQMSMEQAQAIKHTIDEVTPNKIFGWEGWSIEKQLYNQVANNIRGEIGKKIETEFGKNIGKKYNDYANLYSLIEMWKAALRTWKSWWALEKTITAWSSAWIVWHIISWLITPAGTGLWQLTKYLNWPIWKTIRNALIIEQNRLKPKKK